MGDRGSALPVVLALALGGALVLGVALDLARWASTHREAVFAADVGAQAGAAMVTEDGLRRGVLVVDGARAEAAAVELAKAARPRAGRAVTVTVLSDEVCVLVTQEFHSTLLAALGIVPGSVVGQACAVPASG
jgi:hypothetical protein